MRRGWPLVLLALASCRAAGGPATAADGSGAWEAEAPAVYAAVLRDVVRRPGADRYVLDPRLAGTSGTRSLPRDLPADLPVEWYGEDDWKTEPGAGDGGVVSMWTVFHRRYPASVGWTSFAPARLSRDGRSATVDVWHSFDACAGTGLRVSLSKDSGTWRVTRKSVTAIS